MVQEAPRRDARSGEIHVRGESQDSGRPGEEHGLDQLGGDAPGLRRVRPRLEEPFRHGSPCLNNSNTCVCIHIQIYIYIYTYIYMYIYLLKTHTYIYAHIYVCTYICTTSYKYNIYIYKYIRTYTHTI